MIIWSGMGFLVVLIGIAGGIAGVFLGTVLGHPGAGLGAGGGIAAALNFGLCRLLYSKTPRILVDPTSGRQVLIKPSHSLFFIPMPIWTWLMLAGGVMLMVVGVAADNATRKEASAPGYPQFSAANDLIDSKSKGVFHGNTAPAKASAKVFSEVMKTVSTQAFSGGGKHTLMTGGEFLTYCQDGAERIVVLCHVPELRKYKDDDTKKALAELAWGCATNSIKALDPEHRKTLVVALRGIASYGMILHGPSGAESASSVEFDDSAKAGQVLPAFVVAEGADGKARPPAAPGE
jgi:hypothetical protein